ncbi:MAG: diguanylate cyclase [Alphaproteobacteria bacterium]|nr:diguanylate cyclase [Alphaproteobacteria bacterium]MBF0250014.1 diguanylate cyclase [Alphaproteobacteria bacterium]
MTDSPLPIPSDAAKLPFYRRMQFKVVSAMVLLVCLAMGVSAYFSLRIAESGFTRVVSQEFQSTLEFSKTVFNVQAQAWTNWVRHLILDEQEHGLAEAMRGGRRTPVETYVTEHLPTALSKGATVVNREGVVIYRFHSPGNFGDNMGHVEIVRRALDAGEVSVAVVNELNRFMLYAAGPIRDNGSIVGALLIGEPIDNAFVQNIKRNTAMELAVVRDRAVMGSTLKDAEGTPIGDLPLPYLEYKMLLDQPDEIIEARFLGQRYFVAANPLELMDGITPGSLFLAVPRQRLDETEADIQRTFVWLAALVTAVTALVGVAVSHGLTRPIAELTRQVMRIAERGEFSVVEEPSNDETGILANRFNMMQGALRQSSDALRRHNETLEAKVKQRTRELQDEVEERRRAEDQMRHMASHDTLTGLPNRILLMDRIEGAIHNARRHARKCAVLFIDLDGFKAVNDTLGHDKGDILLKGVADRLRACVRENDTVARLGGDEFVILLVDLEDLNNTRPVAEKILVALSRPFDLDGHAGHIGASIGIAGYPDHGEGAQAILKQADHAMYDVKGAGKNSFVIAPHSQG